ncbi:phosphate acetyltransferase [Streptococcus dysgalactiae]|uniref:Phosphate acetyltransferase n=1 Tax=Streptococcus dysgalactiae subsp. dysgalactiae TaxID=99822 RepID=A0A380JT90_STRDY|nr:phosphate acetyltransferase [Streptococcus dysgalactiae]EFY02574.1 phosphotransacetylase [Streptococcus dysgalactiae subsp. dysgalactiae ATCC 27957]MCB2829957.1 phosphate acetyltransferase [Streptococcus dysgalactiae subsp. dysgalactiae]MCB2831799.1 phosphate acetyltransferase [Streptococcus dysgalactiae subsp. dysgalactiae]MCB2833943.1 phosphate acetyltransferase [Streptococcus dysgalactiae subsp. dysgalactiae]MCB2835506.1 phosphate acetyltransferase [Streptococcus dysgalactiae subsp. dysg
MSIRSLFGGLREKILGKNMKIVFPEGNDERVVRAAARLKFEGLLEPIILGQSEEVRSLLTKLGFADQDYTIINPNDYADFERMKEAFVEVRKGKATLEDADKMLRDVNYFGVMLVKMGLADGMVSGAIHSTADTVRPALQIIKTKPGISRTSGVFLMNRENTSERYVFADCAINIDPTAQELAEIAVNTAETAKIFDIDPKIAMLSFSTKGSGKAPQVDKVREATEIAKGLNPDLALDGELQFDAAFVPETAAIKAPDSAVAGQANTFVFPDLQSGNIGYKIAQRLGMFDAIGPILQGLNKPVNDLSRGSSAEDIYKLAIITAAQAIESQG